MNKQIEVPETLIRILKIATCPSLSGRSTLTYQVGCNAEYELHVRITQNSGGGQFNADWVPMATIEKLLTAHPADKPMSSRIMQPVFRSKSANSPAFLASSLLAEGLIKAGKEKGTRYLLGDIDGAKKEMSGLITAGTDLPATPETTRQRKQKELK